MALPEDPHAKKRREHVGGAAAPSPDLISHTPTPPPPPMAATQITAVPDAMTAMSAPRVPSDANANADPTDIGEGGSGGALVDSGSGGTISLSVDDLMQYAQPTTSYEQQAADLEERLTEGASTTVPVGMDEFMMPEPQPQLVKSPNSLTLTPKGRQGESDDADPHNDSGEFPDLLDSDIDYNKFSTRAGIAKVKQDETGLTFATLSGVCPEYPKAKKSAPAPEPVRTEIPPEESVSVEMTTAEDADRKQTQDLVTALASEAVAQLAKANITLPAGTCLVPAASGGNEGGAEGEAVAKQIASMTGVQMVPTTEGAALATASSSSSSSASANFPNKPMTITIQYKIYPDAQGTPQTVAVKRDLAELINEAPAGVAAQGEAAARAGSVTADGDAAAVAAAPMVASDAEEPPPIVVQPPMVSAPETAPAVETKPVPVQPTLGGGELHASSVPPIPVNAGQPDYFKDTVWVMTPAGQKFEVPRIVTGGYDLDQLMCITCNPHKVFKNDKTLMGHMLSHFGVAPKMARCPLCGLTLQKKSYARHIRLHGEKGTLQSQPPLEAQVVQVPANAAASATTPAVAGTTTVTQTTIAITPTAAVSAAPQIPVATLPVAAAATPTATATVMFPCSYCDQAFFSEVELQTHNVLHANPVNLNPHTCEVCYLVFSSAEELSTHAKLHAGSRPHICEICESRFSNRRDKLKHVQRHQGSMPYRCRTCGLTFQSQAHLDKHAASHTKGTQVVSAKINTFLESFSASLENDLLSLDDEGRSSSSAPEELLADAEGGEAGIEEASLTCAICSTKLKNKRSFMIHMKRHAGLLNFKCKFCPKTFQGQVKLTRHLRKHAKDGTDVSSSIDDEIETTAVISTGQGYTISYGGGNKLEKGAKATLQKKTVGSVSIETTKCALCPKTFTDNEALSAHTKVRT